MRNMDIKNKINSKLSNNPISIATLWVLSGAILLRGSSLVITFIIAYNFGANDLGEYAIIRGSALVLSSLVAYPFITSSIKYVAESGNKIERNNWIVTLLILSFFALFVTSLVYFLSSRWISNYLFLNDEAQYLFEISSLLILLTGFSSVSQAILIGYKKFDFVGKSNACLALVMIPVIVMLSIYYGVKGAIIGSCISYLLESLIKVLFIIKKANVEITINKFDFYCKMRKLFSFSIPMLLIALITGPVFYFYKLLLLENDNGLLENGVHEAFYQWLTIIMMVTGALSNVSLSFLSSDKNESPWGIVKVNLLTSLSLSLLFIMTSGVIINSYGDDFLNYRSVFVVMMINAVLNSVIWANEKVLISKSLPWVSFCMFFISVSISLILFINYGLNYGLLGMVICQGVGWIVGLIYGFSCLKKTMTKRIKT